MRASDLLGRIAYDRDGQPLGRIADLLTRPGADGVHQLHSVLIAPRHRGRLFGYEREGVQRPWVIDRIARLLHRGSHEVPWTDLRLQGLG
jgi:hypothetical protein